MTFETPSRMQVVRKQEKEPRLKEFIGQQLALLSNPDAAAEPVRCLLMARSIDSPVVRALASHAAHWGVPWRPAHIFSGTSLTR